MGFNMAFKAVAFVNSKMGDYEIFILHNNIRSIMGVDQLLRWCSIMIVHCVSMSLVSMGHLV